MTYAHWKSLPKADWKTEPVSCTCEVMVGGSVQQPEFCGKSTVKAYPAIVRGWQTLCVEHARKHPEAFDVYELIKNGEKWE